MEENDVCIGDHAKHLCMIGSTLITNSQLDDFKPLVRNPKFICGNCGRVAAKAENLCNPEPLK